jgi:hypothetical protein
MPNQSSMLIRDTKADRSLNATLETCTVEHSRRLGPVLLGL